MTDAKTENEISLHDIRDLSMITDAFDADVDHPRLLFLFSPT